MTRRKRISDLKKLAYSGLCLVGLLSLTQTAQAGYPVTVDNTPLTPAQVSDLKGEATLATIQTTLTTVLTQLGLMGATNSSGQYIASQKATDAATAANLNAHNNNTASNAVGLAMNSTLPPGYSACKVANSSIAAGNNAANGRATAQAMAQAFGNRPATTQQAAADIKDECDNSFAPTDKNDPESSAYTTLDKSCASGGANGTTHARQDRTSEAVLGPLEFPVPPQLKLVNGVYTLPKPVTGGGKDYYPFAAALKYCQHTTPTLPLPAQGNGSNATVDLVSISAYADAESSVSIGPGTCLNFVEERAQYGKEVDSSLQSRYKDQASQCERDNAAGYLADDKLADCETNGRSTMQAKHDMVFRRGDTKFQTQHLALITDPNMLEKVTNDLIDGETHFESTYIVPERQALIAAQNAAHAAAGSAPQSSSLGRPVQQ